MQNGCVSLQLQNMHIPTDVWALITEYCDFMEIIHIGMLCSQTRALCNKDNNVFWRNLLVRDKINLDEPTTPYLQFIELASYTLCIRPFKKVTVNKNVSDLETYKIPLCNTYYGSNELTNRTQQWIMVSILMR
jgi:hypothetical protein